MAKILSEGEKFTLISLKKKQLDYTMFEYLLADTVVKNNGKIRIVPSRFNCTDKFTLKKGEYFNKETVETTVGRFLFNKFVIEGLCEDVLGYVNITIRKGDKSSMDNKLGKAFLNDKIERKVMVEYLDRCEWFGMRLHSLVCSSFTPDTFKPLPQVIAKRNELLEKYKDEVEAGDAITYNKIENECINVAKGILKDDPGLLLYDSGARGSFGNNYKNMCISKGIIYDPTVGKNKVVSNALMEGIKKEDIATMGTAFVMGQYPKSIGTGESGYFSKQILAALQSVVIDTNKDDCGSKRFIPAIITTSNKNEFVNMYIQEKGKVALLTDENITSYIGKNVNLRTPQTCVDSQLCRICGSKIFESLGIDTPGLTSAKVSSTLTNLSMKKFHDTSIKVTKLNLHDMVLK